MRNKKNKNQKKLNIPKPFKSKVIERENKIKIKKVKKPLDKG